MKSLSRALFAILLATPLVAGRAFGAVGDVCDPASLERATTSYSSAEQPCDRAVLVDGLGDSSVAAPGDIPADTGRVESKAERDRRIGNYTCCPRRRPWYPIPDILPATGVPLVTLGLLGPGLLATGVALSLRRLRRHRRSA
jgi:hypothetical protein